MWRSLVLVVLLVVYSAIGQATQLTVPMHRDPTGQLSVSLRVNGKPARLLVDTGANVSTLDRARGKTFIPDGRTPASVAPGAPPQVTLPVATQGRSIGDETFTLLDLSFINAGTARMGTPPFDGQLGAGFFRQYHAAIDFPSMTLRLEVQTADYPGRSSSH